MVQLYTINGKTCTHGIAAGENFRMNNSLGRNVLNPAVAAPVVLPDGSQPLPLGSGYIAALIGSGAMSNVYRIWNPQLETFRAVKLMKPDISPESRQRFQTEMKIMAALSHTNIIEIHSVGEWNCLSYIEMELINGHTLSEIIEKKGSLPLHFCTAVGIMIARALVYAHNKDYSLFGKSYHGIIHRDLKPSNLMIAKEGNVKLMDFGIARPVESSLMTMDGAVMGTMQYLAPEQIDGKNVGVAADIYGLGAVLYEALTGRKAFPQKNLSMLMAAKSSNSFIPLKLFRFNIPTALREVIGKCMLFDPKKRPHSAEDVLEHLERMHIRITRDSAENIVREFLRLPLAERTELSLRKPVPVKAIIATAACTAVIGSAYVFMQSSGKISQPVSTQAAARPPAAAADNETRAYRLPENTVPAASAPPVRKRSLRPAVDAMQKPIPRVSGGNHSVSQVRSGLPGGGEVMEALIKEAEALRYENVLRLFAELSPAGAAETTARLLRLRALFALGKRSEADGAAKLQAIEDGEYYLIRAKLSYDEGNAGDALKILEKSVEVRARLLDAETLRRDYLFYRALCLGFIFDRAPTQENRTTALDAWFEVKNYLRKFPDHSYFQKAVVEMQRIGDRPQHGNG